MQCQGYFLKFALGTRLYYWGHEKNTLVSRNVGDEKYLQPSGPEIFLMNLTKLFK